jgi:hypothetical protein
MAPDSGSSLQSLLARYKALLQAEQAGPPNAERQVQLQGLAGYLRTHHAALLAEAEKQVQAAKGALATPRAKRLAEGRAPEVKPTVASQEAEGCPAVVRYIDPQLAGKLRDQLLRSLQGHPECR